MFKFDTAESVETEGVFSNETASSSWCCSETVHEYSSCKCTTPSQRHIMSVEVDFSMVSTRRKLRPLWKPLLLYTGLLSLLTVGGVYFTTHSGLYMLVSAGGGLLLAALGGGAVGQTSVSQAERSGGDGFEVADSNSGLWSPMKTDTSLRLTLLFYGFGVFLWSLIVLGTLRDTLV